MHVLWQACNQVDICNIPASSACVKRSECADGTRTTATVFPSLQKLMVWMMRTKFSASIGLGSTLVSCGERCCIDHLRVQRVHHDIIHTQHRYCASDHRMWKGHDGTEEVRGWGGRIHRLPHGIGQIGRLEKRCRSMMLHGAGLLMQLEWIVEMANQGEMRFVCPKLRYRCCRRFMAYLLPLSLVTQGMQPCFMLMMAIFQVSYYQGYDACMLPRGSIVDVY
jgi:hypothetical protein